jgi:hypothetical protein
MSLFLSGPGAGGAAGRFALFSSFALPTVGTWSRMGSPCLLSGLEGASGLACAGELPPQRPCYPVECLSARDQPL